ncbi:hypothetical protein PTKIN_Ptkin06aG0127500 [Pterospermum kingtungense]
MIIISFREKVTRKSRHAATLITLRYNCFQFHLFQSSYKLLKVKNTLSAVPLCLSSFNLVLFLQRKKRVFFWVLFAMRKDKGKEKVKGKEKIEEAEDWCFVCKDGGKLLLCDYKGCGKVYHPVCVGKKNSVLKSDGRWTCSRHSCSVCGGPPMFYCLCCPDAVCRLCSRSAEFVPVKLKKGLCETCFELALLAEENAEFDSQGDKLDFEDPGTEEFMFKEYLEIIMEQEELTFDDLHRAQFMRENYDCSSDSDKNEDKDAVITISDGDSDPDFSAMDNSFGKRKKSQKKQVQGNQISNLLEAHLADTLGQPSSDEKENDSGSCSGIEEVQVMEECKRQRTLSTDKVPLETKVAYASIVAENIKLVYLRRSLVEELLMQPDKFEDKVVGSFIRVKRMPGNCSVGTSFQLLQVTGVKKTSNTKYDLGILLEVSCMPVDISINMLNDDDISEEECEDLLQRMKDGPLRKPTVVELEEKAKSLHEDLTKNVCMHM